jgi:hypothetical protein
VSLESSATSTITCSAFRLPLVFYMPDCLYNSFTLDGESITVPGYRNTQGEYHIPLSQNWHLMIPVKGVSITMSPSVVTALTIVRR